MSYRDIISGLLPQPSETYNTDEHGAFKSGFYAARRASAEIAIEADQRIAELDARIAELEAQLGGNVFTRTEAAISELGRALGVK